MNKRLYKKLVIVLRRTLSQWGQHAGRFSAALSFFTLFSLTPLLFILTAIGGLIVSQTQLQTFILDQISYYTNSVEVVDFFRNVLISVSDVPTSIFAIIFGVVLMMFGALQGAENLKLVFDDIWKEELKSKSGVKKFLYNKVVALVLIFIFLIFLFISLIAGTLLEVVKTNFQQYLEYLNLNGIPLDFIDTGSSIVTFFIFFVLLYKYLPRVHLEVRDVWVSALFAAVGIYTLKYFLGIYFSIRGIQSLYGATSSLIIIMLWLYAMHSIILFGAYMSREYVYVFSRKKPFLQKWNNKIREFLQVD